MGGMGVAWSGWEGPRHPISHAGGARPGVKPPSSICKRRGGGPQEVEVEMGAARSLLYECAVPGQTMVQLGIMLCCVKTLLCYAMP